METSYVGPGRLAGRKALITGGDSGLGRVADVAHAREGTNIAINYLPAEEPNTRGFAVFIRDDSRKTTAIPEHLHDEAFCRRLVKEALSSLGGPYIVVCSAGRQQTRSLILDSPTEDFDATMKTNIDAPF